MKQIHWTKRTTELFIDYAMLNDDEIFILKSRIKGMTVLQQAYQLNVSESTISRMIANMRKKYDVVQQEHPDVFPKRITSAKEKWMDEN